LCSVWLRPPPTPALLGSQTAVSLLLRPRLRAPPPNVQLPFTLLYPFSLIRLLCRAIPDSFQLLVISRPRGPFSSTSSSHTPLSSTLTFIVLCVLAGPLISPPPLHLYPNPDPSFPLFTFSWTGYELRVSPPPPPLLPPLPDGFKVTALPRSSSRRVPPSPPSLPLFACGLLSYF